MARATASSSRSTRITYAGPRMEVDAEKRMIFADVDVAKNGKPVGRISPAKFIYKSMGERALDRGGAACLTRRDDLYMVVGHGQPADQGRRRSRCT